MTNEEIITNKMKIKTIQVNHIINNDMEKRKTRSMYAMEALMAAMPKDNMENLGLNEAYRQGLEDMVNWIDFGDEPPFTNEPKTKK